jgi:hypothetical protein
MAKTSPLQDVEKNKSVASCQPLSHDDENDVAGLPLMDSAIMASSTPSKVAEQNNLEHNQLELGGSNLTSSLLPPLQDDTSDSSMDHNPTFHHQNTHHKAEGEDEGDDNDFAENDTSFSVRQSLVNAEGVDCDESHLATLEERVCALEEKLATLSLLLQRQHTHRNIQNSPQSGTSQPARSLPITPPASPPPEDIEYNSSAAAAAGGRTPALDSPSLYERPCVDTSTGKHVRNLSFRVLHTDEFADVAAAAAASMTAAGGNDPSVNLGVQFEEAMNGAGREKSTSKIFLPKTLPNASDCQPQNIPGCTLKKSTKSDFANGDSFSALPNSYSLDGIQNEGIYSSGRRTLTAASPGHLRQSLQPIESSESKSSPETSEASTPSPVKSGRTTPSIDNSSSSIKSKWLDYLNSVQESNYDTDKHMEEFVKVPSAVEALLSFGFWICVDSFLYTLTILPIRFVWSCLLLIRFLVIRIWKLKVPADGPFRFHRR